MKSPEGYRLVSPPTTCSIKNMRGLFCIVALGLATFTSAGSIKDVKHVVLFMQGKIVLFCDYDMFTLITMIRKPSLRSLFRDDGWGEGI